MNKDFNGWYKISCTTWIVDQAELHSQNSVYKPTEEARNTAKMAWNLKFPGNTH